MNKKILSLLLVLAMVVSMIPSMAAVAWADQAQTKEGTYFANNKGYVVKYVSTNLQSVTFPAGITEAEGRALYNAMGFEQPTRLYFTYDSQMNYNLFVFNNNIDGSQAQYGISQGSYYVSVVIDNIDTLTADKYSISDTAIVEGTLPDVFPQIISCGAVAFSVLETKSLTIPNNAIFIYAGFKDSNRDETVYFYKTYNGSTWSSNLQSNPAEYFKYEATQGKTVLVAGKTYRDYALELNADGKAYASVINSSGNYQNNGNSSVLNPLPKGLSYDAETKTWIMDDFSFETGARTAVYFNANNTNTTMNLVVSGSCILTGGSVGYAANGALQGIHASQKVNLIIDGTGSLAVHAGSIGMDKNFDFGKAGIVYSYGLSCKNLTVNGADIKAYAGTIIGKGSTNNTCGISAEKITVNGGRLEGNGGKKFDGYSVGINAKITVNKGELVGIGDACSKQRVGIMTSELTVVDGIVYAYAPALDISFFNAYGQSIEQYSWGTASTGINLTSSTGKLKVTRNGSIYTSGAGRALEGRNTAVVDAKFLGSTTYAIDENELENGYFYGPNGSTGTNRLIKNEGTTQVALTAKLTVNPKDYTIILEDGKAYKQEWEVSGDEYLSKAVTEEITSLPEGLSISGTEAPYTYTLNNFTYVCDAPKCIVISGNAAVLELKGENTILCKYDSELKCEGACIYIKADTTVSGTGMLNVDASGEHQLNAMFVYSGMKITFSSGKVKLLGKQAGIFNYGNVLYEGGELITAGKSYAVFDRSSAKNGITGSGIMKGSVDYDSENPSDTVWFGSYNYANIYWVDVNHAKTIRVTPMPPKFDDRFGGLVTEDNYTSYSSLTAETTGCAVAAANGLSFAGWSTAIDDETAVTSDIQTGSKYYAVWKKNGNVVRTTMLDLSQIQTSTSSALEGWSYTKGQGENPDVLVLNNTTLLNSELSEKSLDFGSNNVIIQLAGDSHIGRMVDPEDMLFMYGYENPDLVNANRAGIYSNGEITFKGSGNLTIYDVEYGVYAEKLVFDEDFTGNLTIKENGSKSAPNCCLSINHGSDGTVEINNGHIDLYSLNGMAIDAENLKINGGVVTAASVTTYAVYVDCNCELGGGSLYAESVKAPSVYASCGAEISGTAVTAVSEESTGFYAGSYNSIKIVDGSLTAIGSESAITFDSYLYVQGGTIVARPYVTATGTDIEYFINREASYRTTFGAIAKYLNISFVPVCKNTRTNEEYVILQKAFDAAQDGDTIMILRDFVLYDRVEISCERETATVFTLDLNDHVIDLSGYNRACFSFDGNPVINMIDSTPEASKTTRYFVDTCNASGEDEKDGCFETYTTSYSTSGKVYGDDYIEVKGGVITGGIALAAINCGDATLHMYGGNIVGNCKGAVKNNSVKSFHMHGGTIQGNRAGHGAGIANNGGTVTMDGGLIAYNICEDYGAGIENSNGYLELTGGEIRNNRRLGAQPVKFVLKATMAKDGGGVYNSGSMVIGGTVKIYDNFNGTKKDNLHIACNRYSGELAVVTISAVTAPAAGMNIGVNVGSYPVTYLSPAAFTFENGTDYRQHFTSDNDEYQVKLVQGNVLQLARKLDEGKMYITGIVVDTTPAAVSGASVKLLKGTREISQTLTDEDGMFEFKNVPSGEYQVVVSEGDRTTSVLGTIAEGNDSSVLDLGTIVLRGSLKAEVLVSSGTPDVVIGNLELVASRNAVSTSNVAIKFIVESKAADSSQPQQASIAAVATGKTLEYIDMTIEHKVDNVSVENITDAGTLIEIIIPFATSGKENITVYRCHGGVASALPKVAATTPRDSITYECYMIEDGQIRVFARFFSTYAIGYTTPVVPQPQPAPSYSTPTYTVTGEDTENGKLVISLKTPYEGDNVSVQAEPDDGYVLESLTVTDAAGNKLGLTDYGNGLYVFKMPGRNVKVSAVFALDDTKCRQDENCVYAKFTDANVKAWYHDGVHYCVENGIMNGTSETTFAPDASFTRAMAVAMLWRMAGCPQADYIIPFTDVNPEGYYAEAVRWAASEGIVLGISETEFAPHDNITRQQLCAILYRYEKSLGGGFKGTWMFNLKFEDKADISGYAFEPVCWMSMKGVVNGISDTLFSPRGNATRAQAACMFQRYAQL